MGRIEKLFERMKAENRAAFIAYVCAGDPDPDTALEVSRGLLESGVDLLELGVPFSDPLADGPTNQQAAQRALGAGATHESIFSQVRRIREFSDAPIVFYTYYNLVFSQGEEDYVRRAAEAGVDGLLVLDLPPEEAEGLERAVAKYDLRTIYIISPTTGDDRIELIARRASGFIYYVSREGVTGVRDDLAADIESSLQRIRKHTSLPIVVGFGISRPEQVAKVGSFADGVVVGSVLVQCVASHPGDSVQIVKAIRKKAKELAGGLAPRN